MNKVLAVLACGLLALPAVAAGPGTLTVDDRAGAFTADGVAKAKGLLESVEFPAPTHVVVMTGGDKDLPADLKGGFEAAKEKKDSAAGRRVIGDWAAAEALKHPDKGVFVLIYTEGKAVFTYCKSDRTTDLRGFGKADDHKVEELLAKEFKAGNKDQGLYQTAAFVVDRLKNAGPPAQATAPAGTSKPAQHANRGGFNVGSLICFGLLAVGAIWLVFGLIRAFTAPRYGPGYGPGGGGYGPGAYGGPGYGPGGGGGGFMSGLMGGLFGAVAGNYLYNSFTGGSSLGATGTDGGGYGGTGGFQDAAGGDGDYSGGAEGGGAGGFDDAGAGGFDDGGGAGGFDDAGGGDYGGGGGDFGGGGDYGGGGGDFGGGDSGGGGDW